MDSDLSVISDRLLQLYLYPVVAWACLLLGLFVYGHIHWGLLLCLPLSLWFAGLTVYWRIQTRRRLRASEITVGEFRAGTLTISRILAGTSSTPAIVFLAADPFSVTAWSTCLGVGTLCLLAYGVAGTMLRLKGEVPLAVALLASWLALPINATGAVTAATFLGWYDTVAEHTPMPLRGESPGN